MKKSSGPSRYWKSQLPVDYLDTSLVINTWENVVADLSGGKPAKLWWIMLMQTNNGATNEDLELEITINGTAYTFTITAVSGTIYYCRFTYEQSAGDFYPLAGTDIVTVGTGVAVAGSPIPFIRENVGLIRVRQTTDVDLTSASIEVNIVWERLEP